MMNPAKSDPLPPVQAEATVAYPVAEPTPMSYPAAEPMNQKLVQPMQAATGTTVVNIGPPQPGSGVYKDHILSDCCKDLSCLAASLWCTMPCLLAQIAGRMEDGTPLLPILGGLFTHPMLGTNNFQRVLRMTIGLNVMIIFFSWLNALTSVGQVLYAMVLLFDMFIFLLTVWTMRQNMRKKYGLTKGQTCANPQVDDILCCYCCTPCWIGHTARQVGVEKPICSCEDPGPDPAFSSGPVVGVVSQQQFAPAVGVVSQQQFAPAPVVMGRV